MNLVRRVLMLAAAGLALLPGILASAVGATGYQDAPSLGRSAAARTWVVAIKQHNAFVAVFVAGSRTPTGEHAVLAYVCNTSVLGAGGGANRRGAKQIAQWFRGQTRSDRFSLSSPGGYRLDVAISRGKAAGRLNFPGAHGGSDAFAALPTKGLAGLYRGQETVNGKTYLAGAIVLTDKGIRGAGAVTVGSTILSGPVAWTIGTGQAVATVGTTTVTASQVGAPTVPPTIVVQFPTFSFNATSMGVESGRVLLTLPNSRTVPDLENLAATGQVTPKLVIRYGSTSTYTFTDVVVSSVRALSTGGLDAVLTYLSAQSA